MIKSSRYAASPGNPKIILTIIRWNCARLNAIPNTHLMVLKNPRRSIDDIQVFLHRHPSSTEGRHLLELNLYFSVLSNAPIPVKKNVIFCHITPHR